MRLLNEVPIGRIVHLLVGLDYFMQGHLAGSFSCQHLQEKLVVSSFREYVGEDLLKIRLILLSFLV